MKKILTAFAGLLLLFSCSKTDILDPKVNGDLNEQTTFSDSARTVDFLFGIYANIFSDWSFNRYNSITAGTAESGDEGNHRLNGSTQPYVINFNGSLSSSVNSGTNQNPYSNSWTVSYTNIRRANVLLAHIDGAPLAPETKTQVKGETRFLRAWYYATLLKNFGGIPLLGDTLYTVNDNIQVARNSYEECVNYISGELDAAAQNLPVAYNSQNYGRITKGACLALKSRVLLYAASPLFNGGNIGQTDEQKKVVGYAAFDAARWSKAAQAAKAVLDLNVYSLYEDNTTAPGFGFSRVFLLRKNNEFILEGMIAPAKRLEAALCPPSRGVGTLQTVPTQNLADAFGMINGKSLTDATSGYDPANPFVNRDPRFNYTFIYNGTLWFNNATGTKTAVNTYVGAAQDGYGIIAYSTGYYWRKMMDDNVSNNGGATPERCWPLIRYAEVLLNYAEASNEAGDINTAYDQLKAIRKRAGIQAGSNSLYGLKAGMTQAEMRDVLYNERRVELAYEDHRYWDVHRWKTAPQNQNVTILAMKITRIGTTGSNYIYEKVPVSANPNHIFLTQNYFFPIMQSEISKDPNIIQNPGY